MKIEPITRAAEPATLARILDDAAALGDEEKLFRLGSNAARRALASPSGSPGRALWGFVTAAFSQRQLGMAHRLKGNLTKALYWEELSERSLERVFALTRGRN